VECLRAVSPAVAIRIYGDRTYKLGRKQYLPYTTTNDMDYSAAITQLRGHFTKSTSKSKTVAHLNADVC